MTQEAIDKAVKEMNRSIKFYTRKLMYQLELRAEVELNNGYLEVGDFDESNIKKYEIILADLSTVKRAVKGNKTCAKVYGTAERDGCTYNETVYALRRAGLDYIGDEYTPEIILFPIKKG